MAARHRFDGYTLTDVCVAAVGMGGRCALPYENDTHYKDDDHAFEDGAAYGDATVGRCFWQKQATDSVDWCGESPDWGGHVRALVAEKTAPHTRAHAYPREAAEMVTEVLDVSWGAGAVRPPDEDAEARLGGAGESTWRAGSADSFVKATPAVESGIGEVVAALADDGADVTAGPWPVRKFLMFDVGQGSVGMRSCLDALDGLGISYSMMVYRPEPAGAVRVALITWDWAYGLSGEVLGDELVAQYG